MSSSDQANPLAALLSGKGAALLLPALAALAILVSIAGKPETPTPAVTAAADTPPTVASSPAANPVASALSTQFTPDQKGAIERIVKDYLVANPEVFIEIQSALEAKMEKEQAEKLKTALAGSANDLYRDPNAPIAGNPKGDVTVVEFFDYNCGYCKRGFTDLAKFIESDPNVRVVLRELPILSKASEEASKVALAARVQGKYWEVHRALLENKGQSNEAAALSIAGKLGLDVDKLKKDMESDEVKNEIAKVRDLAQKLGINGTPHFLVGDRSIPGAPEDLLDQLKSDVAEVRKNGCGVC